MQIAQKAIVFLVVFCINALGTNTYSHPLDIEVKVLLDEFDRPAELYSYYLTPDRKEVKHGQRLLWSYRNGMLTTEFFRDGKCIRVKTIEMPEWTPQKYKESKRKNPRVTHHNDPLVK